MYVNRGMIEAARREGEMAGVMAHEISPRGVTSRYGTGYKRSEVWNARRDFGHCWTDYRWSSGGSRTNSRPGRWRLLSKVQPRI